MSLIQKLATNFGTSSATRKPAWGGSVNPNLRAGMPALYRWNRGGVATPAGNLTLYGAKVPNPWANREDTQLFRQRDDVTDADLETSDYQFLSEIDYEAFANYNWILMLDEFTRLIVAIGATLGAVISNGTGGKARVDFTAETGAGDGATVAFDLAADYDLLAFCNLQVKVATVVQAEAAFTLSDNGSGKIRVTFAAAPANLAALNYQLYPKPSVQFGLALVTPETLKASTTVPNGTEEIATRDLHWIATGAGVTGTIDAQIEVPGR